MTLRGRPVALFGLVYGRESVPESVSLLGGSSDRQLWLPVTGAAVVLDDGDWVLFDTGLNPTIIRDPALRASHYVLPRYDVRVDSDDPLLDEVGRAGLDWRRLALCVVSHLHCDHSGGLRHLVDGPPVVIQEREHDYARADAGLDQAYFRTDYELDGLTWHTVDGDVELAPGLRGLATYGHTPGHMSLAVDLPGDGTVVLAADAADLRRNIDERIPCGSATHPELRPSAEASIARLHELDRTGGTQVWPGHDPEFWAGRRRPPEAYT